MSRDRERFNDVVSEQREGTEARRVAAMEHRYRSGELRIQPHRLTQALDLLGLYGPDVDKACLAREPAVDEWEAGRAEPTWEQVCALVALTGFSHRYFFDPRTSKVESMWICYRSRCERVVREEPVTPLARVRSLFGQGRLL